MIKEVIPGKYSEWVIMKSKLLCKSSMKIKQLQHKYEMAYNNNPKEITTTMQMEEV
jgi:hypothetical protein